MRRFSLRLRPATTALPATAPSPDLSLILGLSGQPPVYLCACAPSNKGSLDSILNLGAFPPRPPPRSFGALLSVVASPVAAIATAGSCIGSTLRHSIRQAKRAEACIALLSGPIEPLSSPPRYLPGQPCADPAAARQTGTPVPSFKAALTSIPCACRSNSYIPPCRRRKRSSSKRRVIATFKLATT